MAMWRSKSSALAVGAIELEQRGAVDQAGQVHAPRTALADQRLGLPRRGEVGAHRLGLAACRFDVRNRLAGLHGRAVMVDEHEIAVGSQRHRQCAADPHGRSGDQRAVHDFLAGPTTPIY
jgi:hypothetical protein